MPAMILPLMTGLILFFSGIVIGYLFTYRDRSDEDALREQLADENQRLKTDVDEQRHLINELQELHDDRQAKVVLLQQVCDDFDAEKAQLNLQVEHLHQELSTSRSELAEHRRKLTEESQRRAELDDLLHELKQKHVKDASELESKWRENVTRLESKLSQRDDELQRFSTSHERISEQLQKAESKIAQLESEIENQQSVLEIAKNNANGLEKEYVSLESSIRAQIELLNESRGQAAAANSAKSLAEDALRDLRSQFDEQQKRLTRAEGAAAEIDSTRHRCVALEQSLENANHRIDEIIAERDMAMSAEKQALTVIGGLRKRTENQEMTIRSLREQSEQFQTDVRELHGQIEHLQMALEQSKQVQLINVENHAATQRELADAERRLEELHARIDDKASAESEFQTRLQHLVEQRDQAMETCSKLEDELKRATVNTRSNEETIRNLRRERGAILLRSRQSAASFPRIMDDDRPSANKQTRLDPVRGVVYTEAPSAKDDLKRISGIAEVLERRLNEFGIYTYKQIMDWDQTAIDEFSVLLTFKDRIQRDDWKGQARYLYREKLRKEKLDRENASSESAAANKDRLSTGRPDPRHDDHDHQRAA